MLLTWVENLQPEYDTINKQVEFVKMILIKKQLKSILTHLKSCQIQIMLANPI